MPHDKNCVYAAATVEEADIVVAWLADHGIEANLPDGQVTSAFGLPNLVAGGIEVCVADAKQLSEAKALIREHEQALKAHLKAKGSTGKIDVTCESCGKTFQVEAREAGHVVDCPHCFEYADVPGATGDEEE